MLKRHMERRLMRAGCELVFCMCVVMVTMRNPFTPASRAFLPGVEDVFVGGNDLTPSRGKRRDASADATRVVLLTTCIGGEAYV